MLLHPLNPSQSKWLKLNIDDSECTRYCKCGNLSCNIVVFYSVNGLCFCGLPSSKSPAGILASSNGRVFTNSKKSFIITDDLRLMPGLDGLNFGLVKDLASDVDEIEVKTISVGLNEIMHLLQWSLLSPAPLTNLLHWHLKFDITNQPRFQTSTPTPQIADQMEVSKNIVIKALMQKSTNQLLSFLVGVDFVGCLFKLLQIPLGSAVSLFGGNSGIVSIDNLYASVSELNSEYLVSPRDLLINPKALILDEISKYHMGCLFRLVTYSGTPVSPGLQFMDLMCEKQIIENPSTFLVSDDLIVTPTTTLSLILYLQSLKIHVLDVEELTINIGTNEALDILKASLAGSHSVLSNALKLMRQPKQEK